MSDEQQKQAPAVVLPQPKFTGTAVNTPPPSDEEEGE